MAYYITVRNRDKFDIVDITKANCFSRQSNLKKSGACSLQEIDMFTTMFNDELELQQYLFNQGIISYDNLYKKLSIRSLSQGKLIKVMYDLLYQSELLYLIPSNLKNEILKRNNDYEFLDAFVKRFYNYYDCRVTINELGCYVSDSVRSGMRSKYLYVRLEEVIDSLMYDYDKKVKYSNVHTLIAFIANYDNNNNINSNKANETKAKIKQKKQIDGQICFFKD